jgi:hypothetical protein
VPTVLDVEVGPADMRARAILIFFHVTGAEHQKDNGYETDVPFLSYVTQVTERRIHQNE